MTGNLKILRDLAHHVPMDDILLFVGQSFFMKEERMDEKGYDIEIVTVKAD